MVGFFRVVAFVIVGWSVMSNQWYWVNSHYGCGAVVCNSEGVIIDSAPIFMQLRGDTIGHIKNCYDVVPLEL